MSFQRAPISEILLRLVVYCLLGIIAIAFWIAVVSLFVGVARGSTPAVYVPARWTVNTARPSRQDHTITRGETIVLEPQYVSYDGPVDLSNVYEVRLRYRDADTPPGEYHPAYGTVIDPAQGRVRIVWGPQYETTNSIYQYDIMLVGNDSASLKAAGTIRMQGSVGDTLTQVS